MPQDIFDRIAAKVPKPLAPAPSIPAPVAPAIPAKVDVFDRVTPTAQVSAAQRGRAPIEYTAGEVGDAQARELILGGAERLGVDLESPVIGTAKNLVSGIGSMAKSGVGLLRDAFTSRGGLTLDPAPAAQAGRDLATGLAQPYKDIGAGVRNRDPQQIARGVGGMATDVAGAFVGTPKGQQLASTAIEKVGGLPVKATKAAVNKGVSMVTGVPLKAETAITKAIKPRASQVGFERSMGMALPEIKAAEAKLGRPIGGIDDLIEAAKLAKQDLRARFDSIKGPQEQRGVSLDKVADAMEGSLSLKTRMESPSKIAAIKKRADAYRRTATIDEVEELLQTTNAELDSYYDKYPAAQRSAAAKNPQTAVLTAQARKLREVLYGAMDVPGGGAAAKELNRRYGSILDLEHEAVRRRNVALRQQPESLTEQMGKVAAAFKVGKGVLRGTVGLDPAGGLMDIGSAVTGRKMAQIIKERNSADYLIRTAFERYGGKPNPIDMPAPFQPKGLLTTGNIQLPAPETSSVTGSLAQMAPGTRAERTGRLLGPGLPLPPGTEPPSGGFKMDVTTGRPTVAPWDRSSFDRPRPEPPSQPPPVPTPTPPVTPRPPVASTSWLPIRPIRPPVGSPARVWPEDITPKPSGADPQATVVRNVEKAAEAVRTPSDPGYVVKSGPHAGYVFDGVTTSDTGRQVFVYRKPGVAKPYLPNTRIKS